jgi:ABC-type glycerol-3-phosphate transport system permease component
VRRPIVVLENFIVEVGAQILLAMTALSIVPITLVFAVLQRYLVSGIATTGLKG